MSDRASTSFSRDEVEALDQIMRAITAGSDPSQVARTEAGRRLHAKAIRMKRSLRTVAPRLERRRPKTHPLTHWERKMARRLYRDGYTVATIAARLDRTRTPVLNALRGAA